MCVCVYVCICIYVCVYIYTHTHIYICKHTFLGHNNMKLEINYRKNNYSMEAKQHASKKKQWVNDEIKGKI